MNQSEIVTTFCFSRNVLVFTIQTLIYNFKNYSNCDLNMIVKYQYCSIHYYQHRTYKDGKHLLDVYHFSTLVLFIQKYVDFSTNRKLSSSNSSESFNKYAWDDGKPHNTSKSHYWTRINYILINYIFSFDKLKFMWEVLEGISRYNEEKQVYSIYMVTNHASIISTLQSNCFERIRRYIEKSKTCGRTLPMFSLITTPIWPNFANNVPYQNLQQKPLDLRKQ